jgi:hypothetical protein
MNLIIYNIFLFLLSYILAKLEIQIEGIHGWASKLPTWKMKIGNFEITGYHLYLWLFLLLFIHLPFIFMSWSWQAECYLLTFLLMLLLIEDSFWFLFNKKFKYRDYWRFPKYKCIPYFYFIIAFLALFFGIYTKNIIWFSEMIVILIIILFLYPFQVKYCQ